MAREKLRLNWKWNYFETLTDDSVKCIICDKPYKLRMSREKARHHFEENHKEYPSSLPGHSSEDWQSHFITQNDEMKCKHCGKYFIIYMRMTTPMTNHLKEIHEIDENKTMKIIRCLYDLSYDVNLNTGKCKCKKCGYTFFGDYSRFELIKHLLENIKDHLTAIPANIRPKRLCESSSISNYDEGAASATSSNYQPNQCRLRELSGPSNYGGEASIATSSNYQLPNVYSYDFNRLSELSSSSNYAGEAGIAPSINNQQPNQLRELSGPSNHDREDSNVTSSNHPPPIVYSYDSNRFSELYSPDGEAGATTTNNYQQANQLGELSNLSNYDGGANVTTTDNHHPDFLDVYYSDPKYFNDMMKDMYYWPYTYDT